MMLEIVAEEIEVQKWSEVRERSVSKQTEYLLGLSTEWRSNSCVFERVFRLSMRDTIERE